MTKKEENKDLALKQNFDLDIFQEFGSEAGTTGLEAVDQTDLKLPKVKVVQMTSEEFTKHGVTPGLFYNTITKESSETLECILLALGKSRVMWPTSFKRGDKPLCRSFDGKTKTEGVGDGNCANCQYARWPEDGNRPPCTMGYVWLGIDKNNSPFRLSAQGASVSPTKDFLNQVAPKLSRGGKKLGIFVFKMVISTEKQSNEKGTFFTLKYNIDGTINPNDYNDLESMSVSYRELFLKAIDNDNINVEPEYIEEENNDEVQTGSKGVLF